MISVKQLINKGYTLRQRYSFESDAVVHGCWKHLEQNSDVAIEFVFYDLSHVGDTFDRSQLPSVKCQIETNIGTVDLYIHTPETIESAELFISDFYDKYGIER